MQTLVCDMEADGLSPTIAWCLVAQELETGKELRFGGPKGLYPERENIQNLFQSAETVVFHNGCKYDAPALENLGIVHRDVYRPNLVDTLVWSQLFWPDRPWGHSVEKWAKRLGCEQKVEHEDWSQFSEAMMERCASDVRIQVEMYKTLLKERGSWDWSLASRIEHAAAEAAFEQEKAGCEFRIEKAREYLNHLEKEMNDRQERLESLLGYWVYNRGEVKSPFKKDGNKTVNCYNWIGDADVGGPFTKVRFERISLRQNEKVALRLMKLGWEPTEYTAPTEKNPEGLPKLRPNKEVCPNLEKMDNEAGKVLSEYSKISHRYGQIKGWVQNYESRNDGRVSAVITGMANTGRRKHAVVVNVPKAEDEVFFGKEMRSLFTHRRGYKLVGWDADSMQLRIGAHYSDDQGFVKALTEGNKEKGTDAHSLIMKDASLDTRADGKKSVYTGLFGGSENKFKQELGDKGKGARDAVHARFPGVLSMKPAVEKAAERGYLKGIDGRKIYIRKDEDGKIKKHTGLVMLIQSCEGIVMAFVYALLHRKIQEQNLDARLVIFNHDEIQAEVRQDHVDRYKKLSEQCMKKAEKYFNFRCPLEIEASVGEDWSTTH